MQPAKVHRYLVSLIRSGLVQKNARSGYYELGPYALTFSLSCMARLDPMRLISPHLPNLARTLNQSVFVAIWSNNGPVVIDWSASNQPISASTKTGTLFPVVMSSTGGAFAAYMPESATTPLIRQELLNLKTANISAAPASESEFNEIISEVRHSGFCRGLGIRLPSIHSITVPIFNFRKHLECVLTCFGYVDSFDSSPDGPIARHLISSARELSNELGFKP